MVKSNQSVGVVNGSRGVKQGTNSKRAPAHKVKNMCDQGVAEVLFTIRMHSTEQERVNLGK